MKYFKRNLERNKKMTQTLELTWNSLKIDGNTILDPSYIPDFGIRFLMSQFRGVEIGRISFKKQDPKGRAELA